MYSIALNMESTAEKDFVFPYKSYYLHLLVYFVGRTILRSGN